MSDEKPKPATPREPLIVRVQTALKLVHDQVRSERSDSANDSDVPPASQDAKRLAAG